MMLDDIGNPRFLELLEEEGRMHRAKAAGYSGSDNPDTWANFREATAWGLTPLQGCLVRLGDKYRRLQNLMRNPENDQVGESFKDTAMDLSAYSKIAICLFEEEGVAKLTVDSLWSAPAVYDPTIYPIDGSRESYLEQLDKAEGLAIVLQKLYGSAYKRSEKDWQADAVRVLKALVR